MGEREQKREKTGEFGSRKQGHRSKNPREGKKQISRNHRPWELNRESRPVWAYPCCPEGHGEIYVGGATNKTHGEYQCHAPWCPQGAFDPEDDWYEELDT